MRGHQLGKNVATVDVHGANPREVIQAHLVDDDLVRLEPEMLRERALEADRHVAETDRAVAGVEQRAGDDPDRVREVDDPRVRGGELLHALRDLEHDGHGAQRFREAAGAGRLLADAAAGERHRLVREPRRLAADPDLDEDEVGAVEGAVELAGDLERAVEALAFEHPRGEPADDVPPLGVDVVQDELPDADPLVLAREPRHELRRVRRAAADDRDLHPFTPVRVTPSTKARWARKKRMITGSITRIVAAMTRFHCTWCSERNWESPIWTTQLSGFSPT